MPVLGLDADLSGYLPDIRPNPHDCAAAQPFDNHRPVLRGFGPSAPANAVNGHLTDFRHLGSPLDSRHAAHQGAISLAEKFPWFPTFPLRVGNSWKWKQSFQKVSIDGMAIMLVSQGVKP
jgi:hypothetical protein